MQTVDAVVAGHLCLDVIPSFPQTVENLHDLLIPGRLTNVGAAVFATGGTVANTGGALHRLGLTVRLIGKVGRDFFGEAILERLRAVAPEPAKTVIVDPEQPSSYTLVLNPPGVDRIFLHCPGANDAFDSADIDAALLRGARLFHFGYPPLMKRVFAYEGRELAAILEKAKDAGATVSLDMARPDPEAESGRAPWETILENALPLVDVFTPSVDELLFMLDRPRFDRVESGAETVSEKVLASLAETCLAYGAGIVLIKCGDAGCYLHTSGNPVRLERLGRAFGEPADWAGIRRHCPCYKVDVVGTTGAGDCTIAGFLAGILHGLCAEEALDLAVGAGACCVERPDALSGVPAWDELKERVGRGWPRHRPRLPKTSR